mgnify:CR=1 FL=1
MRPGEKWFVVRANQDFQDGKVVDLFDPDPSDEPGIYPVVAVVDETGAQVVACHDLATISEARAAEIVAFPELARLARRLALTVAGEWPEGSEELADAVAVREILVRLGVWPADENVEGLAS